MGFFKKLGDAVLGGIPSLLTSGLGLAGDLVGAEKQYNYQRKLAEQQFGYNKELQDIAYRQSLNMKQMDYDYNSISSQIARAREAGINPYAAIGASANVSGGSGASSSVSQGSAPSLSNLGTNAVRLFNENYLLDAQGNKLRADAFASQQQADFYRASSLKIASETKSQRIQNEILEGNKLALKERASIENKNLWSDIARNETQAALYELQAMEQNNRNLKFNERFRSEMAKQTAETVELYLRGQLNRASAKAALSAAAKSAAEASGIEFDNRQKKALEHEFIERYLLDKDTAREQLLQLRQRGDYIGINQLLHVLSFGFAGKD